MSPHINVEPAEAARQEDEPPKLRLAQYRQKSTRQYVFAAVGPEAEVYARADAMVELPSWLTLYAAEVDRLKSS